VHVIINLVGGNAALANTRFKPKLLSFSFFIIDLNQLENKPRTFAFLFPEGSTYRYTYWHCIFEIPYNAEKPCANLH
jgi:hypothetical protein